MKKFTTYIRRLLIISAFFAPVAIAAEQTEQTEQAETVVKVQAEVAKELTEIKGNLVLELQQQLTISIKQQAKSAVSNITESVKALLP